MVRFFTQTNQKDKTMEETIEKKEQLTPKKFFEQENINKRFREILGAKAPAFIANILQIINGATDLSKADPMTVYNAAMLAATLDLSIVPSLGFAYIIPYKKKQRIGNEWREIVQAQFQIGWKGFVQLAQRSGAYKTISAAPIYEGQLIEENPLTGYRFDFSVKVDTNKKPIGYAAYFELLNGFQKVLYMTTEQTKQHAEKYSKSYKNNSGVWVDDFDSMAVKTVIKLLIGKFGPMSTEMQRAVIADQGIIKNEDGSDVEYADHEVVIPEPKSPEQIAEERMKLLVSQCTSTDEVEQLQLDNPDFDIEIFAQRKEQLREGVK